MAAGDTVLPAGLTKAAYVAQNAALIGQAFDKMLDIYSSNSNILGHLQGPPGSGKPFIVKTDLAKGRMDKINMNVGTELGQAGRRGTQTAVNYEEQLIQSNWSVTIDMLRVVVGWNEITRAVANTGDEWDKYAELTGKRVGQIEQEDMLMRCRQRATAINTVRPGNRASLNAIRYSDTIDTTTFGRAASILSTRAGDPATLTTDRNGMPVNGFVFLGADMGLESLWTDSTFTSALQHADVDGADAAYWTGKIPMWRGNAIKRWYVKDHDNPGPIGSSIIPRAVLGDAITSATTAFTMYGGGRTQSSLGNAATLYKPFEYFYGADKLFGESISMGSDSAIYYFVVLDPADGKWNLYSYAGTGVNSNGHSITITSRLHSSTAGVGYTTIKDDGFGGSGATLWTYDATVNKVAFPTGSLIVQVNQRIVPICDILGFAAEAGGKCYGSIKNQRISEEADYGALKGVGTASYYGSDMASDTLGAYRRYVRIQAAYTLPGFSLPQI